MTPATSRTAMQETQNAHEPRLLWLHGNHQLIRQIPTNTEAHGDLGSRIGHPRMTNDVCAHLVSLSEFRLATVPVKSDIPILRLLIGLATLSSRVCPDLFRCATDVVFRVTSHVSATTALHTSESPCPWTPSLLTTRSLLHGHHAHLPVSATRRRPLIEA